ncbi:MAG: hypothetical protein ACI4T6_02450, partial [Candidatus Flemingiibacterium sp.]
MAVDTDRLEFNAFCRFIMHVSKSIEIFLQLITERGLFFQTVSVCESHSGAARRRVGYVEEAYRIAVFPQPPDLVFLADDLKEFLRFLGRYREGTEGCVIVLP